MRRQSDFNACTLCAETEDSVQKLPESVYSDDMWTTSRVCGKGGILPRSIACIGQKHHDSKLEMADPGSVWFCHNRAFYERSPEQL